MPLGLPAGTRMAESRRAMLRHYTISFLVGRACLLRFKAAPARVLEAELALLEETLVRELRPERPTR